MSRIHIHYLQDMVANAESAMQFVSGLDEDQFLEDEKTVFATIRALEVIGEAAKGVPDHIRSKYPAVPWRSLAGMRDKLIHHYFGVDLTVVWKTITDDLPILLPQLQQIIADEMK